MPDFSGKTAVARAQKPKNRFDRSRVVRINVRLPDALRWRLESEARSSRHSINVEIVRRLRDSFLTQDNPTTLVAQVLLDQLDDAITEEMVDIVLRSRAEDELADMVRQEEEISGGEAGEDSK
jgi:Arc-like DNA binding domain